MSGFTNFLEEALLNHVLRNAEYISPATIYVALFNDVPGDPGTGTEVTGTGYVRLPVTFAAPTQVGGAARCVTDVVLEWPVAESAWGTIEAAAIYDAETGGNMLVPAELATPRTISSQDIFRIPVGDLSVSLD